MRKPSTISTKTEKAVQQQQQKESNLSFWTSLLIFKDSVVFREIHYLMNLYCKCTDSKITVKFGLPVYLMKM